MRAKLTPALADRIRRCASWPERCGMNQWSVYRRVLAAARERKIGFAVGGAFAAMTYTGQWRNTKDLDLYIEKSNRGRVVQMLSDLGLQDYYDKLPYDREWIYRSYVNDTIVDVIWAMANQRIQVDRGWLSGPEVEVDRERFRLLSPEHVVWSKLYVLQHDRCDWPDILNVIQQVGCEMDWPQLLAQVGDDSPLIGSLLQIFAWLSPERARELPPDLWRSVHLDAPPSPETPELVTRRARLLDSRAWFTGASTKQESKSAC